ncbi:MAG: ABC transporter ATP-binding protein [Clostridia bacterium]|nr:ABC transporter ATP-binding protein [Clostridia bacterium]
MDCLPVLELRDVTKGYNGIPVFSHFHLSLPKGKIIGLLGPNGSGKTTLIKMAAGLLTPEDGAIAVSGMPIGAESKAVVSYLPERNSLPEWMSPLELIDFFTEMFPGFQGDKALKLLNDLKVNVSQKIRSLSKGTKEKVQLIMVMSRQADLYLLDEPIGGVDPATRDYILQTVIANYDRHSTVLISTHLIADVEPFLDDFLFISSGKIIHSGNVNTFKEAEGITLDEAFRRDFRC